MKDILFLERQRFKQWWIWLILLFLNGLLIFGVIKQVIIGQQFGDEPTSDSALMILTAILLIISFLLLNFQLTTIITEEGVFVRFFPFHFRYREFYWDNLLKVFVRTYKPISEYGGWGLRYGILGEGKAYNISGNKGIQLVLKNGPKILIGTNRPDEVSEVLNSLGCRKE